MSTDKKSISVVIPTFNCKDNLRLCLASISWVDEIIVVDMGSTDGTILLAKKAGARVYIRKPLDGNFDTNRKFGMERASGDWIMKLDSDEFLTSSLQDEIKKFLRIGNDSKLEGLYLFNRIIMFGRVVNHGFVKPFSNELRIVKRYKWIYNPYKYHQQITVEGKTSYFKGFYIHNNFRNVNEFISKMNKYTSYDSNVDSPLSSISKPLILMAPIRTFLKTYILQRGYLDGWLGIEVSLLFSIYSLSQKIKMFERANSL